MLNLTVLKPSVDQRVLPRKAVLLAVCALCFFAGTILAQSPAGQFRFTRGTYIAAEKEGSALITVTRENGAKGKMLVDYQTVAGTTTNDAVAGTDFTAVTNTLTFNDFQMSAQFAILIKPNPATNAAPKGLKIALGNARPAPGEDQSLVPTLGTGAFTNATLNILDQQTGFTFDRVYFTVAETAPEIRIPVSVGSEGTGAGYSVDYRIGPSPGFLTQAGSDYATVGSDFDAVSGTLDFSQNSPQEIVIPINPDGLIEFNEDFQVVLSNPQGMYEIDDGTGTNMIMVRMALGKVTTATVTILYNGVITNSPVGAVDRTFNPDNDPTTIPPFNKTPGANNSVYAIALQSDGNVVIGGDFTGVNGTVRNRIGRLMTNGLTDLTFDPGTGANAYVRALAVVNGGNQRGKILAGGGFASFNGVQRNSIVRLNTDGSVDPTFNPGFGADGPIYSIVPGPCGGSFVAGDFQTFDGVPRRGIALLNENGTLDATFNTGAGPNGPVNSIAVLSGVPVVLAVTRNGSDTNKIIQTINAPGNCGTIQLNYNFFADDDILNIYYSGRLLYTTGLTNTPFTLVTNATDGSVTTNFSTTTIPINFGPGTGIADTSLRFEVNVGETNETAQFSFDATVISESVSRLVIGGEFSTYDGLPRRGVVELNLNGSVNTNFNVGLGANGGVNSVLLQPDGKVVVGGAFSSFDGQPRVNLARLNSNGTLDPSFVPAANDAVYTLALQSTNLIYAGGSFTSISGTRRMGLTRFLSNGEVDTSFLDTSYNQYAGIASPDGFAPIGFVAAIGVQTNGVMIGGSFSRIGGGTTRVDLKPRYNFARLVAGATPGPGNLEFAVDTVGVDEYAGSIAASVIRRNGNLGSSAVTAATVSGVASDAEDFKAATNNLTWGIGGPMDSQSVTSAVQFTVVVTNDTKIEGNEPFRAQLTAPTGTLVLGGEVIPNGIALGSKVASVITIVDDDLEGGELGFSQPEFIINENGVDALITVLRTNGLVGTVTVKYTTATNLVTNPATEGSDYDRSSGILTFNSGQASKTFTVHLHDNTIIEQDEGVLLKLSDPTGGARLGALSNAVLTIVDDDFSAGRVSFVVTNYTVLENGGLASISVRRAGGSAGVLSVQYAASDVTATAPADYAETRGTVTWNDGETSVKSFTVPVNNDGLVEGNEIVALSLLNPSIPGALGLRTNATLTITDDDAYGQISFGSAVYLADENGGPASIIVARLNGAAESVSVNYATGTNGTGVAGKDFTPVSGTLIFGVGELSKTISVPVLDDTVADGTRSVVLNLSFPTRAVLGTITNTILSILDNETVNIPAGSVDTDFDVQDGPNKAVQALALQPDGKVVVGGDFTEFNHEVRVRVARVGPDGRLDASFNPRAAVDGTVRALLRQRISPQDGKILVGGVFGSVNGTTLNNIARLSAGGSLDNTFDPGSGADNQVFALEETAGAKVLVAGAFNNFNSVNRHNLVQLTPSAAVDLSFTPGSGANAGVFAIKRLPSGKILIGGDFTSYSGVNRGYIARLNADGTLDLAFDPGLGADGSVRTIAIQVDEKIVIGGLFTSVSGVSRNRIARLNPDGSLDSEFDPGSGANGPVYAAAIQVDGKIVLGGAFTTFNGVTRNRLTRVNDNGSVDTTINFGSGANDFVAAVAIQPDRRIVIGGGFTSFNGVSRNYLTRIHGGSISGGGEIEFTSPDYVVNENSTNAVLTLRRTGGTTGAVSVDYGTSGGTATPLVDYAESAGTVVFAPGETFRNVSIQIIDDALPEDDETVNLALANPAGGAILGRQPIATLTIISDDSVLSFSEPAYIAGENVPGGRVVIRVTRTGESTRNVTVIYSTANATATAGQDYVSAVGQLTFAPGETEKTFTIQILDDTIVEGNEVVNIQLQAPTGGGVLGQATATLTIVDNDFAPGILSFGAAPVITESGGAATLTVNRVSGRTGVVSVDYTTIAGTATEGVDYTRTAGTLTFVDGEEAKNIVVPIRDDTAVEGNETFSVRLSNAVGGALLGTPTNLVVTIVDDDFGPGSLDQSFSANVVGTNGVRGFAIQSDGRVVIGGGFVSVGGQARSHVARLNTNGVVDTTFNPGAGPDDLVDAVALGSVGKVGIGGSFLSVGLFGRGRVDVLTGSGFPDSTFNLSAGENGEVFALAFQPDGKILAGGAFTSPSGGIERLNANGSLDISFDVDSGTDLPVRAVALQSNGRVVIGGDFTRVGTVTRGRLARLQVNGLLDTGFATGSGANGTINAILILPTGKILIAGNFTLLDGANRMRIARLNEDGSADTTFQSSTGPNAAVRALAIQRDGKIFIAGDFTTVAGTNRTRVARLHADGTLDGGFDPGRGPDASVYAIAVQNDGQVLIGGDFLTVNGFSRRGIARLNGEPVAASPIKFSSVKRNAQGQTQISFSTDPGAVYIIEGSSDFAVWTSLGTINSTGTTFDFTDTQPGLSRRFYRVRQQ